VLLSQTTKQFLDLPFYKTIGNPKRNSQVVLGDIVFLCLQRASYLSMNFKKVSEQSEARFKTFLITRNYLEALNKRTWRKVPRKLVEVKICLIMQFCSLDEDIFGKVG
jgi:hypothetical protein